MNMYDRKLIIDFRPKQSFEKAKRCPDFDQDCKDVHNHYACWVGVDNGIPPVDGYCPYVFGMMNDDG